MEILLDLCALDYITSGPMVGKVWAPHARGQSHKTTFGTKEEIKHVPLECYHATL